ncbi:MAG: DUF2520 domain-containing protein [Spirochaetaceae bacterium]|nr:DUF2520 domain-containing protein [Spirochaetaceae bacterium]
MKSPSFGLVGRGRVARHLAHWFTLEGLSHRQWHRECPESLEHTLEDCETILLAVSDDAIETVIAAPPMLTHKRTIHFSGSHTIPGVPGFHPLMTFGPDLYDIDVYRSIPFVTETGGPAFPEVFPTLPNPHRELDPSKKALYHALCVMSGNFTTLLWARAFKGFEKNLGLPREMLLPYLARTAANLAAAPDEALTGPLARGDRGTVEANLSALGDDPWREVYRAFAALFGLDPQQEASS